MPDSICVDGSVDGSVEVRVSAAVNRSDAANGEHPPESNFAAGLLMAVSIVREMI